MNKKIVLLLALVAALTLVFVACNTAEPVDTTVEETTAAPTVEETTADPETEASAETTEAPAETTEAPVETTEAPVETTEAPVETTEAPVEETTAEPETEAPDNTLNVDLTTVGITGSYPNVDNPTNGPALGLTANDHVIALHYGSINLGEMDLSQYSKVTVTYATPTDELAAGMTDQYNATAKRVLLLNAPSAIQDGTAFEYLPAEGAIITTAPYEMSATNAAITTVEIDLSEVNYNGQVYLSFDFRNPTNNEFGATAYLIWVAGISFS